MALDTLTAKANTGSGTDTLAGKTTGAGFVGAVLLTDATGTEVATGNPLPVAVPGSVAVTGPLTDAQIRATALPVSVPGSVAVTGPLTDTQLRASAVPVSIAATLKTTAADLAASTYNVAGVIAINTDLLVIDCLNVRYLTIQCTSMGTTGVVTPAWSNDNTNYFAASIMTTAGVAAATFNAAGLWSTPVYGRYLRLRLTTATTAGTTTINVQGFAEPAGQPVVQPVSGSVTVSGSLTSAGTTTATVAGASLAIPGIIADVASAALTTTTTTAAFTPTFGTSHEVVIPVTVVSGTTPTLDVVVQESDDTGTNWFDVYHFPRITTTGIYRSPKMMLVGNRVRYVQTVAGTTPSFTRSVNRLQSSDSASTIRQLFDRSLASTQTLNAVTGNINVQNCRTMQMVITAGAITTTAPALQLEGTDDGTNWYSIGSPLTSVANSTVQTTTANFNSQSIRARVSTAGSGATLTHVILKGF